MPTHHVQLLHLHRDVTEHDGVAEGCEEEDDTHELPLHVIGCRDVAIAHRALRGDGISTSRGVTGACNRKAANWEENGQEQRRGSLTARGGGEGAKECVDSNGRGLDKGDDRE